MSSSPSPSHESEHALTRLITQHILVVFIHGFKGTEVTFAGFPERLRHILSETVPNTSVECVVFPAYETKGDLNHAVIKFADWLTTLTVQKEVSGGTGAGSAKIVLCGHSMGGLLAADSLLSFVKSRPDETAPLWPNIVACLAFDTPYIGLHPYVFKNSATKAVEFVNNARSLANAFGLSANAKATAATKSAASQSVPLAITAAPEVAKSPWAKWAPAAYAVGGGLFAAAAAGTAYYKRDDIGTGYSWTTDHMKYVGNLWDEKGLQKRVTDLLDVEDRLGVFFRLFYTVLPPSPPLFQSSRTFIMLPKQGTPFASRLVPSPNRLAQDEIQAHTGMFSGSTNDNFYELGLKTAEFIREAIVSCDKEADSIEPEDRDHYLVDKETSSKGKIPSEEADGLIDLTE